MRNVLFASLFLPMVALAQTQTPTVGQPGTFIPVMGSGAVVVKPTPAAPPVNPWKISYYGEYQGPALGGDLDLSKTQYPGQKSGYAEIDESIKVGYAVSKYVTIGTQVRFSNFFDPTGDSFGFSDLRVYSQWSHMIETSDIDMSGKFVIELPTTTASKKTGKIVSFKFDTNTEFKTFLRSLNFSVATDIQTYSFNDPTGGGKGVTDLYFGVFPSLTMDMVPNVQFLIEGSFDGNHNSTAAFYDYTSAYNDYIDAGPLFTIGPHINTYVALRFFTDEISFKAATLYANLAVAL